MMFKGSDPSYSCRIMLVFRAGSFNSELLPTDTAPLLLSGPDFTDDLCQ